MTYLSYTDYATEDDLQSTAVDEAWYNDNDQALTVSLHNELYRYHNVPWGVFEELRDAVSPGHYYHVNIKNGPYGTAEKLGSRDYVSPIRDTRVMSSTTTTSTPAKVSLATQPVKPTYRYEIVYTVGNDTTKYTYKADADGVNGAVASLNELGRKLGLEFKPKKATVYFE